MSDTMTISAQLERELYDDQKWCVISYSCSGDAKVMSCESYFTGCETREQARRAKKNGKHIWKNRVWYILHYGERIN